MPGIRRTGPAIAVRLVAAWMLALQALVAGLTMGAGAQPAALDAFGNPICAAGAGHVSGDPLPGGSGALPACCTLGCLSGSATVMPPMPDIAPTAGSYGEPVRFVAGNYDLPAQRPQSHGRPRAPPAAA